MFPNIFPIGVIILPGDVSSIKKQILLADDKNAMSPFLNSFVDLSIPESTVVSKYAILFPRK